MEENNAKPPVKRLENPSPSIGPRIPIIRLKGAETVRFFCLSSQKWGFVIHWNARIRRSSPCFGTPEHCEGCKTHLPQKEVFYIEGISGTRGHAFFELTPEAARRYDDLFSTAEVSRGCELILQRTNAQNGRLLLTWNSDAVKRTKLPPESDPEPYLQVLWAWDRAGK